MDVGFPNNGPPSAAFAEQFGEHVDYDRTWAAFDRDRVVGTLRSFATPFTVPGPGEVTAAALTNVTVAPTHHRRGYLTEMITADLAAAAERGEPLGILIASEYPIYGRFGYGPAVEGARYAVDAESARFTQPAEGTVELVDRVTLRKEAPPLYERFRTGQPGSIGRDDYVWDRRLHTVEVPEDDPPKGWQALYRAPGGGAEGYVSYSAASNWEGMRPRGKLDVHELLALSPRGYHALWRYLCEVDLIAKIEAHDRPVDELLPWLLHDGRMVRQSARYDFVWVRVLDVVAALSARRYRGRGRVVIEVADPLGFAGGRYVLEAEADEAACARTDEAAGLALPVDLLGSVYMGAVSLHTLAATGRVEERTAGALAEAEQLFRAGPAPWCSTWF